MPSKKTRTPPMTVEQLKEGAVFYWRRSATDKAPNIGDPYTVLLPGHSEVKRWIGSRVEEKWLEMGVVQTPESLLRWQAEFIAATSRWSYEAPHGWSLAILPHNRTRHALGARLAKTH